MPAVADIIGARRARITFNGHARASSTACACAAGAARTGAHARLAASRRGLNVPHPHSTWRRRVGPSMMQNSGPSGSSTPAASRSRSCSQPPAPSVTWTRLPERPERHRRFRDGFAGAVRWALRPARRCSAAGAVNARAAPPQVGSLVSVSGGCRERRRRSTVEWCPAGRFRVVARPSTRSDTGVRSRSPSSPPSPTSSHTDLVLCALAAAPFVVDLRAGRAAAGAGARGDRPGRRLTAVGAAGAAHVRAVPARVRRRPLGRVAGAAVRWACSRCSRRWPRA